MKAKHYSLFILTAAMLSCLASCRPDEEPAPEPLTIDIKVTDLTPETAQVTVSPSNDNSTYYWNVRPQDEYDSYKDVRALQEADLTDLQESASSAGEEWPEYLLKTLSRGLVSEKIDMLQPQTTYCAYAYELNEDGTAAGSSVASALFTTPKEPCKVKLEIPSTGMTFIEVNAEPENNDIRYYFDQMQESLYLQYGGTDEGAARYFRESLEYTAEQQGRTIEQIVGAISVFGRSNRKIEGLNLDTDYRIYAVEIDESGNVLNATSVLTSTLERQMSDLTIEINIKSLNSYKAEVEFVPSNNEEQYYYQMWPLAEYNQKVEEHGDYRDYCIKTWGEDLPNLVSTGVSNATGKNLTPETDYIIIAFGYKDGTWVTELFTKTLTVPAAGPGTDLKVDIEITETTSHYSGAIFTPSDETVPYMFHYMTEEQYKAFGNDTTESVQNYVEAYIDAYIELYQEEYPEITVTKEQIIQFLSKRSKIQTEFRYLAPSTKHYVWAVSVDNDGQLVSRPALKEFTTKEYILAEDCIIKEVSHRYWDGDTMAAHMPMFARFEGGVGAVVDKAVVEGTDTWLGAYYKGDLTDTEAHPDYYVASNLHFSGTGNLGGGQTISTFNLEWGTWTLCFVGRDADGNFGPVYRERVDFTKDGVSPIEEFPRYNDFHPSEAPLNGIEIPYRPEEGGIGYLPEIDLSSITKTYDTTPKQAAASGPVFEKTEKGNAGNVTEKNQPDILLHVK